MRIFFKIFLIRFVIADFPAGQSFLDFHVAEVTPDDGLLVIANHAGNLSSLYISDVVSEYEVTKEENKNQNAWFNLFE